MQIRVHAGIEEMEETSARASMLYV